MITDNLTNRVYFSSLLPERCPILNAHITEALQKRGIPFSYLHGTKDIWCRDYMPIQFDERFYVFYEYTPNYLQDKIGKALQTSPENVFNNESNDLLRLLPRSYKTEVHFDGLRPIPVEKLLFQRIRMYLVLDGGNVVKCGNKIVMTDKVFVKTKTNPLKKCDNCLKNRSDVILFSFRGTEKRCTDIAMVSSTTLATTEC